MTCVCVFNRRTKRFVVEQKLFFSSSDVLNCTLVHVDKLFNLKGSFMEAMKGKLLVIIIQSSRFVSNCASESALNEIVFEVSVCMKLNCVHSSALNKVLSKNG